jgi:NAD(P)H-hydrate repair Nnr-like enzyme with NAD(P)H-hydrate dehydratase domain
MLIAGTIPIRDLPLVTGRVKREGGDLVIAGYRLPCAQGTGAMISAALATTDYLKLNSPQVVVAGDIGEGGGSRQIYQYLIQNVARLSPRVLALHYCLPDMALMGRLCQAVGECHPRPLLIADAGSMYAAKAAGLAGEFAAFTPDAAELAFLADTEAIHPAYINRHLFCTDITRAPRLIVAAYYQRSAARLLLVKGATDYIARDGDILAIVAEPDVPDLEAIGGTGDTITGLLSAFVSCGLELHEAAIIAARVNRMAGKLARVTVASRVKQVISQFPVVFKEYLCRWSGVCSIKGGSYHE